MNGSGQFTTTLDLGELGQREVEVCWRGYKPERPTEDDKNEIEIVSVRIVKPSGAAVDILGLLTQEAIGMLEVMALDRLLDNTGVADFKREEQA